MSTDGVGATTEARDWLLDERKFPGFKLSAVLLLLLLGLRRKTFVFALLLVVVVVVIVVG